MIPHTTVKTELPILRRVTFQRALEECSLLQKGFNLRLLVWMMDPAKLRPLPDADFPEEAPGWIDKLKAEGQPLPVIATADRYVLAGAPKVTAARSLRWKEVFTLVLPSNLRRISPAQMLALKVTCARYQEEP